MAIIYQDTIVSISGHGITIVSEIWIVDNMQNNNTCGLLHILDILLPLFCILPTYIIVSRYNFNSVAFSIQFESC